MRVDHSWRVGKVPQMGREPAPGLPPRAGASQTASSGHGDFEAIKHHFFTGNADRYGSFGDMLHVLFKV
ncbi:hypothetical protein A9Y76_15385 [Ralstonia insidiosa]|uniref:Uncharacterized protein n=1 Tax=Ralstonia insidiosa TaxID=190721 RepID=A0A192A0C4_9RALS|nr:hypothetical protein A9Y76_15385 [Ralstonia insidiosa]